MVIWVVALATYLLAVFHRSSLAVAGLVATERFDINAAQLASFVMLQLLVYAGMQVPVGLLIDRFGPRRILTTGAVVLTLAQTGFAFAESYPAALVARLFVGMGDAMTFICVLRLVNTWFAPRRIPLITQLTGVLGQMGAILAAAPMTVALRELGWTRAYLVAASFGVVLVVLLVAVVHDAPGLRSHRGAPMRPAEIRASPRRLVAAPRHAARLLDALLHPVQRDDARHAVGLPVLRARRGAEHRPGRHPADRHGGGRDERRTRPRLADHRAALAPLDPRALGRRRDRRCLDGRARVAGAGTVLAPAPARGGHRRRWPRVDDRLRPRPDLQPLRSGWPSATGIINQGGFYASLVLVVAIGLILDWRTPGDSTAYTPEAFRWAMSFQYVLWGVGLTQVWRYRRRTRAWLRVKEPEWVEAQLALGRRARRGRRD